MTRLDMVCGHLFKAVALLAGVLAADAARAELPPLLMAEAKESAGICKDAGGTPRFQGLQVPGAGMTAEVHVPYVTEADLNGDGQPDFITDLAGLDCENAWTIFCGSAGCPVSVWLSGPAGLDRVRGGHVQAWRLDGTAVVLSLHGAMCTPPRAGYDGCEEVLRFDQAAGSGVAAAAQADALSGSVRPRPRPAGAGPAAAEAAAPVPATPTPATPTPAPPMPLAAPAEGWTYGAAAEAKSWYAGVPDAELGTRIDWLCAHGRGSVLALSPYDGDGGFVVSGGMRSEAYEVVVENGVAYAPIDVTAPLFLHIVSDSKFEVSDSSGRVLGRFPMLGAPQAIGQAEGRCQAGV